MRKLAGLLAGILLVGTLLTGCGTTELSDSFDQTTVEETAKQAITYLDEGEYQSVTDMVASDLQDALSADILEEAFTKNCADRGAFKEYESTAVVGQKVDGADMAVAVIATQYEDQKIIYTISFNTDMEISGFYFK